MSTIIGVGLLSWLALMAFICSPGARLTIYALAGCGLAIWLLK
jgi:hypothetical protein